jgi:spore germination protein YaaH
MKCKGLFLCSFILLCFFSNAFYPNSKAAINEKNGVEAVDTVPAKAIPGLFSRIAEVFKFKKYAQLKQKKAIINAIRDLGLKDSIVATRENVLLLTSILNSVKDTSSLNYNLLLQKLDSLKQSTSKNNDSIYRKLYAIAQPPTNEEIATLAEKILPVIQAKIIKSNITAGYVATADTLNPVRIAYYYTNKEAATNLQITRKADVYAFCSSEMDRNYLDFNFNMLNNIIFNGYDIANKNALTTVTTNLTGNRVLKIAGNNKCHILLSITSSNNAATNAFLNSAASQQKLTDDISQLIALHYIDGVNVMLDDVDYNHSTRFTSFIQLLSQKVNLVTITIPAFDLHNGFDINALNQLPVKSFILNFTSQKNVNTIGPVIALNGSKYSLQAAVNRFLNSTVPFQKLVVSIPFYGVDFSYGKKYNTPHYNTLDNLSDAFSDSLYYDSTAASVYAAISNLNGEVTNAIWYDDATSLNDKYKFILNNHFGGIAIEPLKNSATIGYTNIWNGIAAAFFTVSPKPVDIDPASRADSCFCGNDFSKDSVIRKTMIQFGADYSYRIILSEKSALKKLAYLFANACQCKFGDSAISTPHYFDSLMSVTLTTKAPFYYQFYFSNEAMKIDSAGAALEKNKLYLIAFRSAVKRVMLHLNLLMLALFAAALVFYFNRYRTIGSEWKWRTKAEIISIVLLNLLILTGSLFFYLSNHPPNIQPNGSCIQLPPLFLFIIILVGMIAGAAFMHYAVFRPIKSENEP